MRAGKKLAHGTGEITRLNQRAVPPVRNVVGIRPRWKLVVGQESTGLFQQRFDHTDESTGGGDTHDRRRCVAAELGAGIRVNCIAPSIVDTPLADKLLSTDEKRDNSAKRHPLKRVGKAEDHAKAFFEEFRKNSVDTILLPLANLRYVHGDLRPGYSEVHNIVLSKEHEKMVFLDYESICHMTTVRAETNKNLPHVENDGVHESIRARLWLSF